MCKLVANTFNLTVLLIDPDGEIMFECTQNQGSNPMYLNDKQNFFNSISFDPKEKHMCPIIGKSSFLEEYIIISVSCEDFQGTVIIGPTISYSLTVETIDGLINDARITVSREKVHHFYKRIPITKDEKLINISILVYNMLHQQLFSPETVINKNQERIRPAYDNEKQLEISNNLQAGSFHHDPLIERKVLDIIKEGRVEKLTDFFSYIHAEEAGILSRSSYLRSYKNQIIVLITLVSRAAIDGGVHHEAAFTLSDTFIQRLEETTKISEVRQLSKEILHTYTNMVFQVKNERYSKTITECTNYIYTHLYEKFNHEDIAETVDLSPKYLSTLFKKEVGVSISDYIHQAKVAEASKLLSYSNTSISEIGSLLNYSDQSYFTKVFKKYTGITPKQYREHHHLMED